MSVVKVKVSHSLVALEGWELEAHCILLSTVERRIVMSWKKNVKYEAHHSLFLPYLSLIQKGSHLLLDGQREFSSFQLTEAGIQACDLLH